MTIYWTKLCKLSFPPAPIHLIHQKLVYSPSLWLCHFGWWLTAQLCHNLSFAFALDPLKVHSYFSSDITFYFLNVNTTVAGFTCAFTVHIIPKHSTCMFNDSTLSVS